jgi:peptidoglycan/xylan/chitin deacetylase (PgdA/CDA1 family)
MATHRAPMTRFVRRPVPWKRSRAASDAIAFTFDDGPDDVETPRVLDLLQRHGIRATFFLIGRNVARREAVVRRIVAEGHTVGNHTFSHPRFSPFDVRSPIRELKDCQSAIFDACGVWPTLVRPPFGRITPGLRWAARREKLAIQLWSLDSNDWKCRCDEDAERCARELNREARPGDTILLHDNHQWFGSIVEAILPLLESRL